jgi:hypothetical protein
MERQGGAEREDGITVGIAEQGEGKGREGMEGKAAAWVGPWEWSNKNTCFSSRFSIHNRLTVYSHIK